MCKYSFSFCETKGDIWQHSCSPAASEVHPQMRHILIGLERRCFLCSEPKPEATEKCLTGMGGAAYLQIRTVTTPAGLQDGLCVTCSAEPWCLCSVKHTFAQPCSLATLLPILLKTCTYVYAHTHPLSTASQKKNKKEEENTEACLFPIQKKHYKHRRFFTPSLCYMKKRPFTGAPFPAPPEPEVLPAFLPFLFTTLPSDYFIFNL